MSIPVHLQSFKSSGIYRLTFDKSTILNQDANIMRLVVGYSEKGPFNTPVYIKSISDFKAVYGDVSKKMEKRGIWFNKLALQALSAGPILCLNLKKFDGETVAVSNIDTDFNANEPISSASVNVEDIFDTTRFWVLSADKLGEIKDVNGKDLSGYIRISATNTDSTSVSYFIRKAAGSKVAAYNVTVSDWYKDSGEDVPEYLRSNLNCKMSDFMAEIYVFKGKFNKDQVLASETLSNYFVADGANLKLKPYIKNVYGEYIDTLDALYMDSTSGAIGYYMGSLIPLFKDKIGQYQSLDIKFNDDVDTHNLMMYFDIDALEEGRANIDLSGHQYISSDSTSQVNLDKIYSGESKTTVLGNSASPIVSETITFETDKSKIGYGGLDLSNNTIENNKITGKFFVANIDVVNKLITLKGFEPINPDEKDDKKKSYPVINLKFSDEASLNEKLDNLGITKTDKGSYYGDLYREAPTTNPEVKHGTDKYRFKYTENNWSSEQFTGELLANWDGKYYLNWENMPESSAFMVQKKVGEQWQDYYWPTSNAFNYTGDKLEVNLCLKEEHQDGNNINIGDNVTGTHTIILDVENEILTIDGIVEEYKGNSTQPDIAPFAFITSIYGFVKPNASNTIDYTSKVTINVNAVNAVATSKINGSNTDNVYGSSISFIDKGDWTWDKSNNYLTSTTDKSLITFLSVGDCLLAETKTSDKYYANTYVQEIGQYVNGNEITYFVKLTDEPLEFENNSKKYLVKVDSALNQEIGVLSPIYLEGYTYKNSKPKSTSMIDKLNWQNFILSVLTDYKGIRTALLEKSEVDYRYIIDTFESYVGPSCKSILTFLAKEKQSAFAILNFPSIKNFVKCPYASFTDSKGVFDTKYVVKGYNPSKSHSTGFSLPSDSEGASFGAFYTCLKFSDGYLDSIVPSAALVSNLFMEKYLSRQPYYIVAGPNYGVISASGLVGPDYNFCRSELDDLEPFGVNAMVYRPSFGTFINSNQTAKQTPVSALSKVNIRELVIYLQDEIEKILQSYQWEFNNQTVRNKIKDKADAICLQIQKNGGIIDYLNVMDESNNTPDIIDNEMAVLSTHIEPGRGMGKMVHELTLYRTGMMRASIGEE